MESFVNEVWSATVGLTPPSPGWTPGATLSLLVAHLVMPFDNK